MHPSFDCRRRSPGIPIVVVLVFLSMPAASLTAQTGTVEGKVTATSAGQPVPGAEVALPGTGIGTRTDATGSFRIRNVSPGAHELRIIAIGYKPVTMHLTVTEGQATTANAELTPSVLQLDAI